MSNLLMLGFWCAVQRVLVILYQTLRGLSVGVGIVPVEPLVRKGFYGFVMWHMARMVRA